MQSAVQQAPKTQSAPRVIRKDLQALRAIAVLAVVVYHLWPNVLPGGFVGVDIFFVISGFLITGHIFKEIEAKGKFSFRSFYARRAKRILPPAYVTIVVALAGVVAFLPQNHWGETTRQGVGSIVYLQNIALSQNSVDYLAQDGAATVFQHFWTLSVEEQFYLILPLLLVGAVLLARRLKLPARRVTLALLGVGAVASLIHAEQLLSTGDPSAYFLLSTRFWELGAGSFLAVAAGVISRPRLSGQAVQRLRKCAVVLGWVGIVAAIVWTSAGHFPGLGAALPVGATLLVIWAKEPLGSGLLHTVTRHKATQYIGDISYSLYLTHWPLVILTPFALPNLPESAHAVVILVLAFGTAAALHHLVERKMQGVKVTQTNALRILGITLLVSILTVAVALVPRLWADYSEQRAAAVEEDLLSNQFDALGAQAISGTQYSDFASDQKVVIPAVSQARTILPSGAEGACKSAMADPRTPECEFGPASASNVIALVGDSHIEQYLPAFEDLAQEHDLKIRTYFHASCPFNTAQRVSDEDREGPCAEANEKTFETLAQATDLDMIVTSNRTDVPWSESGPGPVTGFIEMWDRLEEAHPEVPVVVLEDNPMMLPQDGTTDCVGVNSKDPSVCSLPYEEAQVTDHQMPAVERSDQVNLIRTKEWFCPDNTCPAVIGNVLVYRDQQHLTTLYARSLGPRVWQEIEPLLPSN